MSGVLCDIIIDGGFEINYVSKDFVDLLALTTIQNSHLYDLGWLTKGTKLE